MSNFANVNTPADAGSKRSALYREHDKENLAPCVTLEKKSPNPKPKKKANISSSILSPPTDDDYDGVIVISLDGNIGAGKSTLLKAVAEALPEVEVVVEPVGKLLLDPYY